MTIAAGSRLGPYEIVAPVGAGGMGEVFRARDTRLDRDVAIKVLPGHLSQDPGALTRFEREAKAVAALSHPNILALHDFGKDDHVAYAVMELLAGQTLRERLSSRPMPVRKAIEYAIQIANGLAAAHDRGIVHRDLKPENLFVTDDGRGKILDFGLAKVVGPLTVETNSPTADPGTEPGVLLGTVGYMSPEQVRGESVDARSDIFSFGAVLYEMLSGHRAFRRETRAETLTAILRDDPPELSVSPGGSLPPGLVRIVQHCLEKNPQERFQSARDLAFDLANIAGVSSDAAGKTLLAGSARPRRRMSLALALPALAVGLMAGAAGAFFYRGAPVAEPIRVRALTFSSRDSEPGASPDGRLIAFTSWRDGVSRIWIKQLAGGGEAPLTAGSDRRARFSPDGSSLLFLRNLGATQAVYRVALVGGEPRKLVDDATEADWSPDGKRIVFIRYRDYMSEGSSVTLAVFDTETAKETVLLDVRRSELFCPRWSPDGGSIAYVEGNLYRNSPTWRLMRFDMTTRRAAPFPGLVPGNPLGGIAWTGTGRELLYVQSASVMGDTTGQGSRVFRYDTKSGKRVALLWHDGLVSVVGTDGGITFCDVPSQGRVLFSEKLRRQNLREMTLGSAAPAIRLLTQGSSIDRQPVYSPDGKTVLFSSNRTGNLDLWVVDRASGSVKQLTDDASQDWDPGFTPDGKHILWSCDRGGHLEAWIANSDGSSARQLTHDGLDAENPTATADGKWIVYWSGGQKRQGVWKIRPDGSGETRLFGSLSVATDVSPDGRYVLLVDQDRPGLKSTVRFLEVETGREVPFRITVPFTLGAPGVIWGRGRWSPDGKSIYFIGQDAAGLSGVFVQDFVPGRDTSATRRPVAGFSSEYVTESFGVSPDGTHLTISTGEEFATVLLAEEAPGASPPERKTR